MAQPASQPDPAPEGRPRRESGSDDVPVPVAIPGPPSKTRRAVWPWIVAGLLAGIVAVGVATRPGADGPAAAADKGDAATAVLIADVARRDMVLRSRYPGEVFADAAEISSRLPGHVREVAVRIGDEVEEGQVLARLDASVLQRRIRETQAQLAARRAAVEGAKVARDAAQRNEARAQQLVQSGAGSEQELDDSETIARTRAVELDTARAQVDATAAQLAVLREDLRDTTVRAPFAGIVARRDVDPGTFVAAGDPLLRLVAQSPKRVRFRVPEYDMAGMKSGLPVRVFGPAADEDGVAGTVQRLAGEVSPDDRTLLVEGVVDDSDSHGALRPGTYVDVVVDRGQLQNAWVVDPAAVLERVDAGGIASVGVFVLEGDDRARWVHVRVLGRDDSGVAIEAVSRGLDAQSRVLIRGHRDLADGAVVRVVADGVESVP